MTTAHMPAAQVLMAELTMDAPYDANTRKLRPGARSLLAADDNQTAASVDLWFGYDVRYRPQPMQSTSGNYTPRYVGLRNQVLGGLYFQQVKDSMLTRTTVNAPNCTSEHQKVALSSCNVTLPI